MKIHRLVSDGTLVGEKIPPRKIVVDGHREGGWKPGVFLVVDDDRCNPHFVMFSGSDANKRAESFAAERNRALGLEDY